MHKIKNLLLPAVLLFCGGHLSHARARTPKQYNRIINIPSSPKTGDLCGVQ